MLENNAKIGLKWAPKLPSFTSFGTKPSTSQESLASTLRKPETELVEGLYVPPSDPRKLNKLARKEIKDTAGKNWFDMPAPTITPEIKKDLELLKLRGVLDPKRHYKKEDTKSKALPKYFQIGTVIESPFEYHSHRLTKKERKTTLVGEVLSDEKLGAYRKRKVIEIEKKDNFAGVEKWKKKKGNQSFKHGKDRRH